MEYRPVLLPKIAYSTKVFAEIIWNFQNCYFDEVHFYEFMLCQEGNTSNRWSSYYHIFSKSNKWLMAKYGNKTRTAINAKTSVFLICVEAIL